VAVRVAINGFGRIGRLTFRNMVARANEFEVVAINDLTSNEVLATLLKYDSIHRRFPGTVGYDNENLIVDGRKIRVFEEKNPAALPWGDLGIDVVVESTGVLPRASGRARRATTRTWMQAPSASCSVPRPKMIPT
jgi:glyceraldehyde 3-phosphate dehydrogenase